MAKIHIENGKISSSGDYGLYHGTSQIASIESSGLRVVGDILAENFVVSSSVTHFTQSFSSGSTIFGDDSGDTHKFTGSLQISGGLNLRGTDGGTATIDGAGSQVTLNLRPDSSNNNYIVVQNNEFSFRPGGNTVMNIESTGEVGINTTDP